MPALDVLSFARPRLAELDLACLLAAAGRVRQGLTWGVAPVGRPLRSEELRPRLATLPAWPAPGEPLAQAVEQLRGARLLHLGCDALAPPDAAAPRDFPPAARRCVLHLAAGDAHHRELLQAGAASDNLVLAGWLPGAVYRCPYRGRLERPRAELARTLGLAAEKPWVLFAENFDEAFFSDDELAARVRQGADPHEAFARRDHARYSFRTALKWWAEAAQEGGVELLVSCRGRVSRVAWLAAYRQTLGQLPESWLHFAPPEDLPHWIAAADAVVAYGDPALVEAAAAGKPAWLLAPLTLPQALRPEWMEFAPRLASREEFLAALRGLRTAPAWSPLTQWAESQLGLDGDVLDAVVRLAAGVVRGRLYAPAAPAAAPFWRRLWSAGRRRWEALQSARRPGASDAAWEAAAAPAAVEARIAGWAELLRSAPRRLQAA